MATGFVLPPPPTLEMHSSNASEKWKGWRNYLLATELKTAAVVVATVLTVIGEKAREVYSTFTGWTSKQDEAKIHLVLEKFAPYCMLRKNVRLSDTVQSMYARTWRVVWLLQDCFT